MQQRDFELESMMEKILGHTSNLAATKFETRFEEMEERVVAVETQLFCLHVEFLRARGFLDRRAEHESDKEDRIWHLN